MKDHCPKPDLRPEHQKIVDNMIGKRVMIKKPHPRAGEIGTVKAFNPSVGITGKPGFEIEPEADPYEQSFYIFSGNEIFVLPKP